MSIISKVAFKERKAAARAANLEGYKADLSADPESLFVNAVQRYDQQIRHYEDLLQRNFCVVVGSVTSESIITRVHTGLLYNQACHKAQLLNNEIDNRLRGMFPIRKPRFVFLVTTIDQLVEID